MGYVQKSPTRKSQAGSRKPQQWKRNRDPHESVADHCQAKIDGTIFEQGLQNNVFADIDKGNMNVCNVTESGP